MRGDGDKVIRSADGELAMARLLGSGGWGIKHIRSRWAFSEYFPMQLAAGVCICVLAARCAGQYNGCICVHAWEHMCQYVIFWWKTCNYFSMVNTKII
jgi:hypothetical protein